MDTRSVQSDDQESNQLSELEASEGPGSIADGFAAVPSWACALLAARSVLRIWPLYVADLLRARMQKSDYVVVAEDVAMSAEIACILNLLPSMIAGAAILSIDSAAARASIAATRVILHDNELPNANSLGGAVIHSLEFVARSAKAVRSVESGRPSDISASQALDRVLYYYRKALIEHADSTEQSRDYFEEVLQDLRFLVGHNLMENDDSRRGQLTIQLLGEPLWLGALPARVRDAVSGLNNLIGSEEGGGGGRFILAQMEHYNKLVTGERFDSTGVWSRAAKWLREKGFDTRESDFDATSILTTSSEGSTSGIGLEFNLGTSLDDAPTVEDALNRKGLAESLAALFSSPDHATPCTLALWGGWGSGKSSVMKMIEEALDSIESNRASSFREKHVPQHYSFHRVHFNVWEYEHTENIRAGLAQETIKGLTKDLGWFRIQILKLRFAVRVYGARVFWLFLRLLFAASALCWALVEAFYSGDAAPKDPEWWIIGVSGIGAVLFIRSQWGSLRTLLEHPLATELSTYMKLPDYGEHLGIVPEIKRHIGELCALRGVRRVGDIRSVRSEAIANRDRAGRHKVVRAFGSLLGARPGRNGFIARNTLVDVLADLLGVKLARENTHRLVIFVDDLDRCQPTTINETLDALRLIMDLPDVLVVLAIDHRIAFQAVARHYSDVADNERDCYAIARDYLGKLIQLSICLHESDDMSEFINKRLFSPWMAESASEGAVATADSSSSAKSGTAMIDDPAVTSGNEEIEALVGDLSTYRGLDSDTRTERGNKSRNVPMIETGLAERRLMTEAMRHVPEEVEQFQSLVRSMKLNNPRQLIRLQNTYRLLKTLPWAAFAGESLEPRRDLMNVLFWLEYVYELPRVQRKSLLDNVAQGILSDDDPVAAMVLEWFGGAENFRTTDYLRLMKHVGRFVLPAS